MIPTEALSESKTYIPPFSFLERLKSVTLASLNSLSSGAMHGGLYRPFIALNFSWCIGRFPAFRHKGDLGPARELDPTKVCPRIHRLFQPLNGFPPDARKVIFETGGALQVGQCV